MIYENDQFGKWARDTHIATAARALFSECGVHRQAIPEHTAELHITGSWSVETDKVMIAGRRVAPKDVHILISGPRAHVYLHGEETL